MAFATILLLVVSGVCLTIPVIVCGGGGKKKQTSGGRRSRTETDQPARPVSPVSPARPAPIPLGMGNYISVKHVFDIQLTEIRPETHQSKLDVDLGLPRVNPNLDGYKAKSPKSPKGIKSPKERKSPQGNKSPKERKSPQGNKSPKERKSQKAPKTPKSSKPKGGHNFGQKPE